MFVYELRVFYEDTDAGGVVYHANYLKFMERARSEWLRACGFDVARIQQELKIIFVVMRMEIDYKSPARLGDWLQVRTEVIKLGKVGMSLKQSIYNRDVLICSGLVKLAALDSESMKMKAMPDLLLSRISC